jgi:hypothetical protein
MNTELTNEQAEKLAGMVKAECRHEGEKLVGYDEVTCRDCGWITPSGQHMGPHNGWFPSHDAHKQFKKYGTYPGMDEARSINRNAAPTPPSAPVQQSVEEAWVEWKKSPESLKTVQIAGYEWAEHFALLFTAGYKAALSTSPLLDKNDQTEGEAKPLAWRVIGEGGIPVTVWIDGDGRKQTAANKWEWVQIAYSHPQPPQPDSNELGGGEK